MRRSVKYFIVHPLAALLAIILIILLAAALLSTTQIGTALLASSIQQILPGLRLKGVEGALFNQMKVQRIEWESASVKFELDEALVDVSIQKFAVPAQVQVDHLTGKRLVITIPPSTTKNTAPITIPDLRLPAEITLDELALQELVINSGSFQMKFKDINLQAYNREGVLQVNKLVGSYLDPLGGSVQLDVKGKMGLRQPHPTQLDGVVSSTGSKCGVGALKLTATGDLPNYRFQAEGEWAYKNYPKADVKLAGTGSFDGVALETGQLLTEAGDLDLTGQLAWRPDLTWDVKLNGTKLNPEALVADLSGSLEVAAASTGQYIDHQLMMSLDASKLLGTVRDYPIDATVSVGLDQGALTVNSINAAIGQNRLLAKGESTDGLLIDWELDAPVLEQLHPALEGKLVGKGKLSGKIDGSEFMLDIEQLAGQVLDYPVEAQGGVSLANGLLTARELKLDVGDNHLAMNGVADESTGIDWQLDAQDLSSLYPELRGNLKGKGNAQGLLDGSRLALRIDELAGEVLERPVQAKGEVLLRDQLLTAKALQLVLGSNQVELDGTADEVQGINWKLNAKDLSEVLPSLKGQLTGEGNAQGLLDGSRVALRIDRLQGELWDHPVKAAGSLQVKDKVLTAQDVKLDLGENHLVLDGVADEAQGLVWQLDAKNLAQISPQLTGNVVGKGTIQGLLDGSRLNLQVNELSGSVLGQPVKAVGRIKVEDKLLSAQGVQLDVADNRLTLNGVADEQQGLDWVIEAPKLAQLVPSLSGSLSGKGNLQGLLDGSRLVLRIDRLAGTVKDYPIKAAGSVRIQDKVLSAQGLQVDIGDNHLTLNGVANELKGVDWSLEANKLAQLYPSLTGKLTGKGNFRGLLDGSRFTLKIERLDGVVQEFPIHAEGQIKLENQLLAAQDLNLAIGKNQIRLEGVADEKQGLTWVLDAKDLSQLVPAIKGDLKGKGKATGLLDGSRLTVNINSLTGKVQNFPINASGEVRIRNKQLAANGLNLSLGKNRLQLDGVANDAAGLAWSLDAKDLSELNPSLKGNVKGSGRVQGLLDASKLTVKVDQLKGTVQGFPVSVSGEAKLRDKIVTANNVLVDIGQNRLRLNGSAGTSLGVDWELDAKNLSQLSPAIRGSVKGNGRLSGRIDGSQFDLEVANLRGQIEGRPLQANGKIKIQGQQITLQAVKVIAGVNQLEANGRASEPFDIQWRIQAPNLAQLWPGLSGSLKGDGLLRGTLAQPQIQGNLQGNQIGYQDLRLAKLSLQANQVGAQYDLRGTLEGLRQGTNQIKQAEFSLQGQLARHSLNLKLVHQAGRLEGCATGAWNGQQWRGAIESLSLRDTAAGNWQLTNAVAVNASAQAFSLANACLVNPQNARICSKADWTAQRGLTANGVLQQVPISLARAFLPATVQLPGVINADYQFEQRGGQPFARVNLVLPDNVIVLRTANKRTETLQYTQAKASLVLNNRIATLQAQVDIRGRGQLRADGRIDLAGEGGQPRLDVRANIAMPDISWLQAYSPQVDELKGQVNGDLRIVGLLNKPQVTGNLRLQNASLYLPETGAKIEEISLSIQANQADQMNITGSLRAGQGILKASGVLRLAKLPNWSADLRLQGSNLLLMNTYEVQGQVSPDLTIQATPKSVVITGSLRVPEASINIQALPASASVRSDDIVFVGRTQPGQARKKLRTPQVGPAIDIQPNILVEVGERVRLNAFGVEARLNGRLRILRNKQDIIAEGALGVVDGFYKAYGQNLKIERGRLIFNGPMTNPGLDVRATREVEDDITVGISLGGTVKQPESTLFSSPQQTQSDTLSYLLTGRALSGISGGDTALLTRAITSLGLAGGESLAQSIGGSLGLDEVGINSNGGDYKQSELALGKKLGSRLYVKYIIGLFDSLQKIAVTYQINKRLELEATSGANQSIGLIYKLETDTGPFGK